MPNASKPHPLRKEVKRLYIKQGDLATLLDVSGSTVSLWLSGKRTMPPLIQKRIEKAIEKQRKSLARGVA